MTYGTLDYLIGASVWIAVIVSSATFAYYHSRRMALVVNKAGDFMVEAYSKFVSNSYGGSSNGSAAEGWESAGVVESEDGEVYMPSISTNVLRFGAGGKLIEPGTDANITAYVMLRAYKDYVERDLVFVSSTARRKHGVGRMKLEPFKGSISLTHPVLSDDTMKLVKPMLVGGGALLNSGAKAQKSISKTDVPIAVEEVDTTSTLAEAESAAPTPKAKIMPSWKGRILDYGIGERSLTTSDENDPENKEPKMIKQYRIVIDINGQNESIWGQDLHRAIKDSGAVKGDLVEVLKTGRKRLENGTSMNLYSIKKLA